MCAESSGVIRFGRIFSGPNLLSPPPPLEKSRPNSYRLGLLIVRITNLCVSSETFISRVLTIASKSLTITESIKMRTISLEHKTVTTLIPVGVDLGRNNSLNPPVVGWFSTTGVL